MTNPDKQTEDKIFNAATLVFEEKGMDGARMQDIADKAGINKALLHYYFRTKDRLFEVVFQKLYLKVILQLKRKSDFSSNNTYHSCRKIQGFLLLSSTRFTEIRPG
jgi:AcrR family transcriptional regulator